MSFPFNKFNQFTKDLIEGVHVFGSNTFKTMLCNTAPTSSNAILSDLTEIGTGNGYSAGGTTSTMTTSTSSGTAKATLGQVVFTASGGTIGPLRYTVAYNTTPTSPLKPLVGYYDYGSSITLNDGETFTVTYDATNGLFTVA
jgi:hypothetical protein